LAKYRRRPPRNDGSLPNERLKTGNQEIRFADPSADRVANEPAAQDERSQVRHGVRRRCLCCGGIVSIYGDRVWMQVE